MKQVVTWAVPAALCLLGSGIAARAQGTINFNNFVSGLVDARVYWSDFSGIQVPAPGSIVGQLYASAPGGILAPVGAPLAFNDEPESARGYLNVSGADTTRIVPGVEVGGLAQAKMVAWSSSLGATYEEAVGRGAGGIGESAILTGLVTGGGGAPPAALVGLQSFSVVFVPEPAVARLTSLGIGLLLLGRRRR